MSHYRNPALRQLKDQQIKFAPRDARLKQIERAEGLLNELDPHETYRYPELCEKITSYRGEMYQRMKVLHGIRRISASIDPISGRRHVKDENS